MTLREKRAAKIAAQEALVEGAKNAGREMTAEENKRFDSLQAEIDSLSREIEEEERSQGPGQRGQGTGAGVNASEQEAVMRR